MASSKITAVIDIGTAKTVVLIIQIRPDKKYGILGIGQTTTQGMRKGEITNIELLKKSVHDAIQDAEKIARFQVSTAFLSLTGAHLSGERCRGGATVSAANGTVSHKDIARALDEAKQVQLPEERVVISRVRQPFFLDKKLCETAPVGKLGSHLEVSYWRINADEHYIREIGSVAQSYNLDVKDFVISSLASSAIVVNEEMKKHGTLVIDIGAGTSDFVLYKKGCVTFSGVIPIGGDHITNDLAIGLRLSQKNAEQVKRKHASAVLSPDDANNKFWLHGDHDIGDRQIRGDAINKITSERVREIFSFIKRRLDKDSLNPEDVAAGVILTGGTARLKDIQHAATEVFGIDTRIGELPAWVPEISNLKSPEFATVLGLTKYASTFEEPKKPEPGWLKFIKKIFNF